LDPWSSSLFVYHNMGWDQAKEAHFRENLTFATSVVSQLDQDSMGDTPSVLWVQLEWIR